jgi:hypothetical protein
VVSGLDLASILPPTGEGADFDNRFGVHRDAQDVVCHVGSSIYLGHLREDGVGFWNFFCG